MSKNILAIIAGLILISGAFYVTIEENNEEMSEFIECLKEEGVVIYGSSTCPACKVLEDSYGGREVIDPIYLDCSGFGSEEEVERCSEEMQTDLVPEIQIKGELLEDRRSPQCLSEITGCEI